VTAVQNALSVWSSTSAAGPALHVVSLLPSDPIAYRDRVGLTGILWMALGHASGTQIISGHSTTKQHPRAVDDALVHDDVCRRQRRRRGFELQLGQCAWLVERCRERPPMQPGRCTRVLDELAERPAAGWSKSAAFLRAPFGLQRACY
jgi:hypothetical protein